MQWLKPGQIHSATNRIANVFEKGTAIGSGFYGSSPTFSNAFNKDVVRNYINTYFNKFKNQSQSFMNNSSQNFPWCSSATSAYLN